METLPFTPDGTTLLVGPSNVGKTRLTAKALDTWLADHGPDGVVVLDFAPEVERDGTLLGGRLSRFTTVPDDVWHGVLEAHAPRADAETPAGAHALAESNAANARRLLDAAPDEPTAIFVNDATIALQADETRTTLFSLLTTYCNRAECCVLNAFESDELGIDDIVSRNERLALDDLRRWVDAVVEL